MGGDNMDRGSRSVGEREMVWRWGVSALNAGGERGCSV
jgi:hypothetical protein